MMRWVAGAAFHKFELPDLCHLSPEERVLYKEQVTAREKRRLGEEL